MNPALLYDDAAAFSEGGEADGYDAADLFVDAAALFHELNEGSDAAGVDDDSEFAGRDAADLYEEAAGLVDAANDNDLYEEWHQVRRSGDAAFFGKIIKKARKAVSKATSAVASVARTAAKVAAPVTNIARKITAPLGALARVAGPLLPLAKTVASFVPGAGTAVAAALSAAESMAKGKSLEQIALDAATGAIPGGPLAQMAVKSAMNLAQGQSLTEAAIAAARSQIPTEAQQAFDIGMGAVLRQKAALKAAPPRIRRLGQRLVQPDARGLELDDAARLCQCSPSDAAAAIGSITGAVRRIALGGSPVLLREPELSAQIRSGRLSLDNAVTALGSHVAPWQGRERRGVPVRAGQVNRVAAAFEPARYSPLTASETRKLLRVPAVRNMPRSALIRMVTGADARGLTPDGGFYIVDSSDYGLQQIATKLGHPGDGWKELRNANLAPLGAQKKQGANGAFTSMNPGDKLELPAGWKTVSAAPPPPAPPAGAPPVSITVPGVGPVTLPPVPGVGGGSGGGGGGTVPVPTGAGSYKRSADGGALPAGARLGGGATKIAHQLSSGEYPSELAKRYARPAPDTAWRDLRPANPSKKLNADGTFATWPVGEVVNIPDTWVTAGAGGSGGGGTTPTPDPEITTPVKIGPIALPPIPQPPIGGGGTTPPLPPLPAPPVVVPAPPAPPKIEDVLPTPPKDGPGTKYDGGGGETGGGGSSDYWKGYTADGAVQAKAMLIRYLVEVAKTQTSPPLGTQTVDTTALWDQRAQEATRIFQRAQGLITSGTPDDVTYQALRAWNAAYGTGGGGSTGGGTTPAKTDGGSILPLLIAVVGAMMLK